MSLPTELDVNEVNGTVTVCAMLSLSPSMGTTTRTAADIFIMLETMDNTSGRAEEVPCGGMLNVALEMCLVSAVAGSDYSEVETMMLTFPAGSMDGDDMTQCTDVNITDDSYFEGDETFTVTLTLLTTDQGVTTGNDMTTVTIIDDEGINIRLW